MDVHNYFLEIKNRGWITINYEGEYFQFCCHECEDQKILKENAEKEARKVFESFDGMATYLKDEHNNYLNPYVHNLWMGFKKWFILKQKLN